jgi:hypothetical protein
MANPLAALDRFWLAPAPAERLATVRLLTGAFACVYLVARLPVLADFAGFDAARFEPVGPVSVLSAPLPGALVWVLWALCLGLGLAFTAGWRFVLSGPAFAALFLWVTSYRNSWGMTFHTENLLVFHLAVLGCSASAAALSVDARRSAAGARAGGDEARFGWPLKLLVALAATAYLLAGVAKLKNSGLGWMEGEVLRNYIAFDCLRKAQVGSLYSPFGAWLVQRDWPFPIIGVFTLIVEFGAPLALLGGRSALVLALALWGFHVGVLATMAIAFPYALSGVALAAFVPCERLWQLKPLRRLHARIA